ALAETHVQERIADGFGTVHRREQCVAPALKLTDEIVSVSDGAENPGGVTPVGSRIGREKPSCLVTLDRLHSVSLPSDVLALRTQSFNSVVSCIGQFGHQWGQG